MTGLAGRRVLITGGGSGAGADLARGFAEAGAEVVIAGRRAAALEAVAARLGGGVRPVVADVTDEASVRAMFAAAGPCDVIIANAGQATSAPFRRTATEDWNRMIAVNLTGVFLTFREALDRIPGWGRLIAIASTASLRGYPKIAPYAAAKHGVLGLVRSLALEVASGPVTVNAICPGYLETPMTERTVAVIAEKTGRTPAAARAALEALSPQKRLYRPAEVTAVALFLCGPQSDGINGAAIPISGGEA
ncbi:MAG: SDR family oxidoreductase [Rhodobacteraceae bacterium]|nr:SDR family oxidoreductase [Paracoccaceae bacterium]